MILDPLPADMTERTAYFSTPGERYRFWLKRLLDPTVAGRLLAIMMNPSRAAFKYNDPTTTVMCGFAGRWGFGEYGAVNMDPTIEPDSRRLILVPDDVWAMNLEAIKKALAWCDADEGRVITAWGSHDWRDERLAQVVELLRGRTLLRLGVNANGSPRFPRAIRRDTRPEEWTL